MVGVARLELELKVLNTSVFLIKLHSHVRKEE
jgi:hypothetical protein